MRLISVRRVSCGVTAALTLALAGTSCTAESASSPAATHITVGAQLVVDNVGLYIAADEGIFKRFGRSAFQKAMTQAQAVADSSRAVVERAILTYRPKLTKMEAAILALDTFPTSVDAIQLQRVADLMYSGHVLAKPFRVDSLLTM